jgi:predicted RNase H-like HicB family nuclease
MGVGRKRLQESPGQDALECIRMWPMTEEASRVKQFKIVVERHSDGYVAYPLGLQGVVVGQGSTYEEALEDTKSAIRFHIESFGHDALDLDDPVLEVTIEEAAVGY